MKATAESNKTITIRPLSMGHDVVFLVSGGVPHLGAWAMSHLEKGRVVLTGVRALPGHLEGDLAAELAEMATLALHRTVAVLVGIHLHEPTKQDIIDIVSEAKKEMSYCLEKWHKDECLEGVGSV